VTLVRRQGCGDGSVSDERPPEGTGREHPAPPFPEQPIDPPGIEGRMNPLPHLRR
jgi:hypothetical protein